MLCRDAKLAFLAYARNERGYAPSTLKQFSNRLNVFQRHVNAEDLEDFNLYNLKTLLYHLQETKHRPRTIRAFFALLRTFGAWAVENGMLSSNDAERIKTPKIDAPERAQVSDDVIAEVLAACDRHPTKPELARAVLLLFATTGLRRSELLALRLEDIDINERTVTVKHSKGDKRRIVAMPKETVAALRAYLRVRPGDCRHRFFFAVDRYRRLADNGLRTLIEETRTIAGYKGDRSILPHSIRHNYATWLLRNSGDIESVRESLGHHDLKVTQVYLHTDTGRLKQIADALPSRKQPGKQAPASTEDRDGSRFRVWRRGR